VNLVTIVAYLLWLLVLTWAASLVLTVYGLSRQRLLAPISDATLQGHDSPTVSIIVPARNEEHRVLADSMRSILAQDYPCFEVIAID